MQPLDTLRAGADLLGPILVPHGFTFRHTEQGRGSGGDFAAGEFVWLDRRLELHFRRTLGLVRYHLGPSYLAHEEYMQALGVPRGANQYPGFSDDPLDGFRHLAHDLAAYGGDFIRGDAAVSRRAAAAAASRRRQASRESMAGAVGDVRARAEARERFRQADYRTVVALLESLEYPDLLSASEQKMLSLARSRSSAG